MKRNCEICGSGKQKILYHQSFVLPTLHFFHGGYDVVVCQHCGFIFASNIPDIDFFENYYREMSKKTFYLSKKIYRKEDVNSTYNKDMNKRIWHSIANIKKYINKKDRILDIGCYTGELIAILKNQGYAHVTGIDPSPYAVQIARKKYGLDAHVASGYDDLNIGTFDVVILTHVLEHIKDLRDFIRKASSYLVDGGVMYVETPDANNFFMSQSPNYLPEHQEAFQQFSVEHINFFTKASTSNLLRSNGFEMVFLEPQVSVIAIMASVWKKLPIRKDRFIEGNIKKYIRESTKLMARVKRIIHRIEISKKELYIWGAGVHTQRLLALTGMKSLRIKAFIDSDPAYHNAKLMRKPIISPQHITLPNLPILISSKGHQEAISKQINEMKLKNPIILLYQ